MKIDGINHSHFNPYNKLSQPAQKKEGAKPHDQLDISPEAKQMQQQSKLDLQRQDKVQTLKKQIQSGGYQVDPQQAANKFYEFWTGR